MATDILQGQNVDAASLSVLYDATHMGLRRTGAKGETYSRVGATPAAATLTSTQTLYSAIVLPANTVVTNIVFLTNTTAAGTPTHATAGLYSSAKVKLAQSADLLTAAWAASSEVVVPLTAPYTTTVDDVYYLAVSITATTTPTFSGVAVPGAILAPAIAFSDATAVTATLPTTATVSAAASQLYAYVS